MKVNVKKLACVTISLAMIASACACSKKDGKKSKKESTGCQAAAEEFVEALISRKTKSLKKICDLGDYEEVIDQMSDDDFINAVMDKATYEVDEDSIKEKKKEASCDVVVKVPDYEDAMDEADGDIDDFQDAIDGQKEKNYKEIELSLEFDVDDDEFTLTNAESAIEDLYADMYDVLIEGAGSAPTAKPSETNDPDTDPTKDTDDTQTTPTTTASQDYVGFSFHSMDLISGANSDVFYNGLNAAGNGAEKNSYEASPDDMSYYDAALTKYIYSWDNGYNNQYSYMEFATADDAKNYFDENYSYVSYLTDDYYFGDDYSYGIYVSDSWSFVYYCVDNMIIGTSCMEMVEENAQSLENFWKALGAI